MDPTLSLPNQKIQAAIEFFHHELSTIRAGRANPSMIENVSINAYGSKMKLVEIGTIAAPQPSLLTVQIWDSGLVNDALKAIQEANLGINPSNEGNLIRLPIPQLTAERREEFVKLVDQKAEAAKVEIRQIRQDMRKDWEKAQEAGEFGEDELDRREKLLQDMIDRYVNSIDEITKQKQAELREL